MPISLEGRRILVVEDEFLIAMEIEHWLREMGCIVVGPVGKLDDALRLSRDEVFDAALLDVTLGAEKVFPVIDELLARAIPFALASGYSDWALPEGLRDRPRLNKPFSRRDLELQVILLCGGGN